jgi:hypothetical protein
MAHGANLVVENVGVQAEEVTNVQEEHAAISESVESAMDPVVAADPGESTSDQASSHGHVSAWESEPISRAPEVSSALDTRQFSAPLHDAPNPISLGSSTSSGSAAGSSATSFTSRAPASITDVLDLPVQPAVTQPRTQLQDNIVKPKVFTYGTMRYDHLGLAMTREPKTLHEALHDKH